MRNQLVLISRNMTKVCLIRALFMSGAMVTPGLVPFWESIGLKSGDFLLLELWFAAGMLGCMLPNGQLADYFGKKRVLLAGTAIMPLAQIWYAYSRSFPALVVGELMLALAFSLVLGPDEALMAESLRRLKRSHRHSKIWGRVGLSETLAATIGNVLGGYLGQFGPRVPFWASTGGYLLMFLLVLTLHEPKVSRNHRMNGIRPVAKFCLLERSDIRWVIFFPPLIMAISQAFFWLYPQYFVSCGVPARYHGWVFAVWSLTAGSLNLLAAGLEKKFGRQSLSFAAIVLVGGALVLLGTSSSWFSPIFVVLIAGARGFIPPVFSAALNRRVPSEINARALSVRGICAMSCYMVALLSVRQLAASWGTQSAFLGTGLAVLAVGSWMARRDPG
jgi:predicted MFS family arabinose efflux permease